MPVTRIVIFATLILLMPSSIRADSFAVIFGSFVNKEFAEERKTQLEAVLGELVTITSVEISGTRYYRTRIVIPKVEEDEFEVRLDGTLDESIWEEIPKYDNMLVSDPDTLVTPRYQTHMRFFNTSKGMYIGVNLEQPKDTLVGRQYTCPSTY